MMKLRSIESCVGRRPSVQDRPVVRLQVDGPVALLVAKALFVRKTLKMQPFRQDWTFASVAAQQPLYRTVAGMPPELVDLFLRNSMELR